MIGRIKERLDKLPWLPQAAAALGFGVYAWQTWGLSRRLATMILDESMYLYKGYLFASGRFAPYQDYGPLTNHMPLSFMIPGWVQAWFGPGMDTGRAFAFLVGLVMLAGIWLAFTRLGGKWWGAAVVWLFVFSPAWQEVYSQGLTQGLVNAFIAWGLVLLIGEEREHWQLALAAALVTLSVMTRVNTLPILGLMVLYIFWQHGWKKGLTAALAALVVGVVTLAFFWPGVLKFLAGWVPEGLVGFVDAYRSPWSQQHVPDGFAYFPLETWWGDTASEQFGGVRAFYETLKFNSLVWVAVIAAVILWPRKLDWPNDARRRLSVFLLVTWLAMAVMHVWVAASGTSCHFFCMSGYFTFFNLLGLMLLPAVMPLLRRKPSFVRQIVGLALLVGLMAGTLYSAGITAKGWQDLMFSQIPRISDGRVLWGETGALHALLENKLHLDYHFLLEVLPYEMYWVWPVVIGLVALPLLYLILFGKRSPLPGLAAMFAFGAALALGAGLGYSDIFYKETANLVCEDDVIETHEAVAAELREMLEPGAQAYWELTSNMLLLYLPDLQVYPPLLNNGFNYVYNSQPDESDLIYKFSYWDRYLQEEWIDEADVLLIPGQFMRAWQPRVDAGEFEIVGQTSPYESCRPKETTVNVLVHTEKP